MVGEEGGVARVQFDVRLEKFDGAGRPFNRQAQIVVDITRRGGDVDVNPVSVGPLQRTR